MRARGSFFHMVGLESDGDLKISTAFLMLISVCYVS